MGFKRPNMIRCMKCGSTKNVSYWTYHNERPEKEGFYCGKCGASTYRIALYLVLLVLLTLIFILIFIK